jgi:hypothetical protein
VARLNYIFESGLGSENDEYPEMKEVKGGWVRERKYGKEGSRGAVGIYQDLILNTRQPSGPPSPSLHDHT